MHHLEAKKQFQTLQNNQSNPNLEDTGKHSVKKKSYIRENKSRINDRNYDDEAFEADD